MEQEMATQNRRVTVRYKPTGFHSSKDYAVLTTTNFLGVKPNDRLAEEDLSQLIMDGVTVIVKDS